MNSFSRRHAGEFLGLQPALDRTPAGTPPRRWKAALVLVAAIAMTLPVFAAPQGDVTPQVALAPQGAASTTEAAPIESERLETVSEIVPVAEQSSLSRMRLVSRSALLISSLTIFALAVFVGFEVITKVPPTLHTPLMSGSNAISGITIVGAMLTAGHAAGGFGSLLGMLAVILATVNVVGGFLVTHRMLRMFKQR